jgi:hypothetical protein
MSFGKNKAKAIVKWFDAMKKCAEVESEGIGCVDAVDS